jgi:dienelactone hydrolase
MLKKMFCGGAIGLLLAGMAQSAEHHTGPWDMTELARPPQVEWLDASGPVRGLYYEGLTYRGQPTRVFAWYARPEKIERQLPAMVLVHGGGGKAFRQWAELWANRGYAAIAMDLAGVGPDGQRMADGGPGQTDQQKFFDIAEGVKNAWTYHAIANVVRAASLLSSLEEVDAARIGITGISWGGYLTSIAAGVDQRFKLAVPVYGCGFLHENSVWLPQFEKLAEHRQLWIKSFDPSQYLPGAAMPMLWVNGTNDFAYPLDSYQNSYRAAQGKRTLCVTVRMPHGHPAGWAPKEIGLFADSILKEGLPLASWKSAEREGREVNGKVESTVPLVKAELHYTTDGGQWQQRVWHSATAQLHDGQIKAQLPAEQGITYFLTVTDERGAVVSSEHESL